MKKPKVFLVVIFSGYFLLTLTNGFLLNGCEENELKESSIATGSILLRAKELLKIIESENITEGGRVTATAVKFDNTTARKFLESKKAVFDKHYRVIKENYDQSGENLEDSLYMLALINEMMDFLTGGYFENRCIYLNKIRSAGEVSLSKWLTDEVFASFLSSREAIDEWQSMSYERKLKDIHDFLMVGYKDADCEK